MPLTLCKHHACFVTAGSGQLISSTQAHKQGINAVSCLPTAQGALALSAGKDHAIRLWAVPALQATASAEAPAPSCLAVYKGHTDAVEDVAASSSGSAFCSGAWDGNVHIWRTGKQLLCPVLSMQSTPPHQCSPNSASGHRCLLLHNLASIQLLPYLLVQCCDRVLPLRNSKECCLAAAARAQLDQQGITCICSVAMVSASAGVQLMNILSCEVGA